MALKLEALENGWQIICFENSDGSRILWDVTGDGESFTVPADITTIRKRSFAKMNCKGLKSVYIPASVTEIQQDAFDSFDASLHIYCECPRRPAGYFEGEYNEEFEEDDSSYYVTHYGSWLHRSVIVKSRDNEGRLTWLSPSAEEEIRIRPTTHWNCEMP